MTQKFSLSSLSTKSFAGGQKLMHILSGGACFLPRWCELLVGRPPPSPQKCAHSAGRPFQLPDLYSSVVDDMHPYQYWSYPTRTEVFYPRLHMTPDTETSTPTIPHLGLARAIALYRPIIPLHNKPYMVG